MLGTVPRPLHPLSSILIYIFLVLRSTLSQRINPPSGGDTKFSHSVLDEMALSQNGLSQNDYKMDQELTATQSPV